MPLDQPESRIAERTEELRMSFGEHLEELRSRLIRALVGIGVAAVVTFYFGFDLIGLLARPLLQIQYALGYTPQTIETDPTVGFTTVYLPVSLIAAVIVASPWVIYQVWMFVVSGLYDREKRAVYFLAPFSTVMAALGVSFTYFILLPICLLFFLNFASFYPDIDPGEPGPIMRLLLRAYGSGPAPEIDPDGAQPPDAAAAAPFPVLETDPVDLVDGMVWINRAEGSLKAVIGGRVRILSAGSNKLITPLPRLGQYVRFAAIMMLGVVIAFQVPVVMLVVGWTHLVDPAVVARARRYALFASALFGAILTPTDIASMIVLAIPLYCLFEFGLLLMRWADRSAAATLGR